MSHATVRIYQSELDVIISESAQHATNETGGDLFGLWSNGGSPTIFLATRPGPNSVLDQTYFRQDLQVHAGLEKMLWSECGIQTLGLWHSHHQLGLRELSAGDRQRAAEYCRKRERDYYCDILCCLESSPNRAVHVKPYVHVDATTGLIADTEWTVLAGVSPIRQRLMAVMTHGFESALHPATEPVPPYELVRTHSASIAPSHTAFGVRAKRLLSFGFGRSNTTKAEIEAAKRPATGPEPPQPGPDGPLAEQPTTQQEADRPPLQPIDNPNRFVAVYLAPHLRSSPKDVDAVLNVGEGGRVISLRLAVASTDCYCDIGFGWDGAAPVVLGARLYVPSSPGTPPVELFAARHEVSYAFAWAIEELRAHAGRSR